MVGQRIRFHHQPRRPGAIDMPTPSLVCYSTAKAAVAQLSRRLRTEARLHPRAGQRDRAGWIDTPMNERHSTRNRRHPRRREAARVRDAVELSPMGIPGWPTRRHRVRRALPRVTGRPVRDRHRDAAQRRLHHALVTAPVPLPTVVGPIVGPNPLFGAPRLDVAAHGYVVEGFWLDGTLRGHQLRDRHRGHRRRSLGGRALRRGAVPHPHPRRAPRARRPVQRHRRGALAERLRRLRATGTIRRRGLRGLRAGWARQARGRRSAWTSPGMDRFRSRRVLRSSSTIPSATPRCITPATRALSTSSCRPASRSARRGRRRSTRSRGST